MSDPICSNCGESILKCQGFCEPIDKIERIVDDYLEGYELRGDNGDYTPSEQELFITKDIIMGLIEEEDFLKALLPSLDFEKVGKCLECGGEGSLYSPVTVCHKCNETGQVRSPLEFSDVDWNKTLNFLSDLQSMAFNKQLDKSVCYEDFDVNVFTTKSGQRIVRR